MLFKHNYASSNQLELINSIEDLANGDLLEIILKGKPEFKMFTSVLSLGPALTEQDMRFMNKLPCQIKTLHVVIYLKRGSRMLIFCCFLDKSSVSYYVRK